MIRRIVENLFINGMEVGFYLLESALLLATLVAPYVFYGVFFISICALSLGVW
jgi:hypothetical protein